MKLGSQTRDDQKENFMWTELTNDKTTLRRDPHGTTGTQAQTHNVANPNESWPKERVGQGSSDHWLSHTHWTTPWQNSVANQTWQRLKHMKPQVSRIKRSCNDAPRNGQQRNLGRMKQELESGKLEKFWVNLVGVTITNTSHSIRHMSNSLTLPAPCYFVQAFLVLQGIHIKKLLVLVVASCCPLSAILARAITMSPNEFRSDYMGCSTEVS